MIDNFNKGDVVQVVRLYKDPVEWWLVVWDILVIENDNWLPYASHETKINPYTGTHSFTFDKSQLKLVKRKT